MKPDRTVILRFAAGLCATLFALNAVAQSPQPTAAEQYLLTMANQERAQRGIAPLQWDAHLAAAARPHAEMMAQQQNISHQYPGEPDLQTRAANSGAHFHLIAENVAEAATPEDLHNAWMHSEGHRHNLLEPQENAIGIAVVERNGMLFAVEDFSTQVATVDISGQEKQVADALRGIGMAEVAATDDARKTCRLSSGYSGAQRPYFVMRYTTVDLTLLPTQLKAKVAENKLHHAAVGACAPPAQNFSNFSVAVMLYP